MRGSAIAGGSRPPGAKWLRPESSPDRPIAGRFGFDPSHIDAIDQSHQRCAALGVSRIERADLAPLGRADLGVARERNRRLHHHAAPVMELLCEQIAGTHSMVVLTDATGTVLHSIGDDDFLERASKVALRPGAVWSEQAKGTNAVGTALVEERPTLVHADEHYLHVNQFLTCSAAPILDPRGNMLGVLDVSGDHRSYHQHTMALVTMSARMIENRWLTDDCRHVMRLHFHSRPPFIGTLMEGILALGADGRIVGANRGALEQLGASGAALRMHTLSTLLSTTVGALVDRFRSPLAEPVALRLADGRTVHAVARFDWPAWTSLADGGEGPPALDLPLREATPAPRSPAPTHAAQAGTRAAPQRTSALDALRTGSALIDGLVAKLRRTIDRDIPILINGETGSGKEQVARALHADSARASRPFVAVSGAQAPGALLEAQSHGGTLFIEDVGDMPPAAQTNLLRVLREHTAWASSGSAGGAAEGAHPTIVCATRHDLREHVATGQFREDLFYRLDGLSLRLPALRDRGDVAVLAQRYLTAQDLGRPLRLSIEAVALFEAHPWPGNLRQLFNVLRTACALAAGEETIETHHLPDDLIEDAAPRVTTAHGRTLQDVEIDAIRSAVEAAGGNISEASKRLGISRNTIYRKLRWNRAG